MTQYNFSIHDNYAEKPEPMISFYEMGNCKLENLEQFEQDVIRALSHNGFKLLWKDDLWIPSVVDYGFKSASGVVTFTIYPNDRYRNQTPTINAENQRGVIESVGAALEKDDCFRRDDRTRTLNTFEVRPSYGPKPCPLIEFSKVWEHGIVENCKRIFADEGFEFLRENVHYVEEYTYARDVDWEFKSLSGIVTLSADIWEIYFISAPDQPGVIESLAAALVKDVNFQRVTS